MNAQNQNEAPSGAGARGSPATESPVVMRLTLENIGPLNEARIELGKGLTVLYGLNGTGKTTVAKVLRLLTRLNAGIAEAGDVIRLVKRQLRLLDRSLAEKEGVGRIVYDMDGAALEIRCIPDLRGAKLKVGGWERYVVMGERLPMIDKPKVALVWVAHDAVRLYGVGGTHEGEALSVEDLLTPSVFRSVVAGMYDDAMDLYEEVLSKVNNMLETLDYNIMYRDGVYYKHGALHVYTPDEVSSGVRRFALIYLAATVAKKFAEYAKIEPVLFMENFEDSLDVTMMSAAIDILRTSDVISVVETHSGYPLREATIRSRMNYYVFADGKTTNNLTVELFKREIAEWTTIDAS